MAVFAITRKGKRAMKLQRDYLRSGKRVGTNYEVFPDYMMLGQPHFRVRK